MTQTTDSRQRILDAASLLFHTRSYDAVGIAAVCDHAGVSKGSFFHFFGSKRDLALAVMDQFRQHIDGTLVARAFAANLPPMERLDRFVQELYAFQKARRDDLGHTPGCPFGNLAMEQATQDEALRLKADGCLRSLASHIRDTLTAAVQSGEISPINVDATADAMLGYLEGIQLLAKSRNDPDVIRQLGPALKTLRVPLEG
jgi:TetR/AcrR family transcriptional repressor of nem operon